MLINTTQIFFPDGTVHQDSELTYVHFCTMAGCGQIIAGKSGLILYSEPFMRALAGRPLEEALRRIENIGGHYQVLNNA